MTAGVYELNLPVQILGWYGIMTRRSIGGPPREVLSEFDSSISGLSIMKAREFENSKIEG